MVLGILIFGTFNLALGFGLAVALEHAPRWKFTWLPKLPTLSWKFAWRPRWPGMPRLPAISRPNLPGLLKFVRWPSVPRLPSIASFVKWPAITRRKEVAVAEVERPSLVGEILAAIPEVTLPPPTPAELPTPWIDALTENALVATSFVEASVQVLRLEVGKYRERLVDIDGEIRALPLPTITESLQHVAEHVREVNRDWLDKQADAASHLSSRRGSLGIFEDAGQELENVLLDQAAQIETTINNLQLIDFVTDVEVARKKLIRELCRLVDLAHTLRDRMSESLLSIMIAEGKAASLDPKFQVDSLTNLCNRFGLELLLDAWWRDDPSRNKMASCVLIDIDKLYRMNERHGPRATDVLLGGFGRWLDEQVRRDRGCDRATRIAGQAFVVFLGDTGPRNATSAAERIRQTLAATTFEIGEQALELTASCGVVEIGKEDDVGLLIKHLQTTMRHAKQAGRDRTSLDEGSGPQSIEPPRFNVKQRVMRLQD